MQLQHETQQACRICELQLLLLRCHALLRSTLQQPRCQQHQQQ
jgi:hypothetical protein